MFEGSAPQVVGCGGKLWFRNPHAKGLPPQRRRFCWMCGRGRLGVSARRVVSVQGCWSEEAFTPGSGRPGRGRSGHLLSRWHAEVRGGDPMSISTPSLRPQPDRTRAGRCSGWTGSSWRWVGPVAIRGAWDIIWGPRTGCVVSEVPGTCPGSRQSHRSTPPAAQARRGPGGRASGGCRPDAGNPGAATGPRAVSGHRSRGRPLTTTRQMGHHPHIQQKSLKGRRWVGSTSPGHHN
jgi:hypothetical protein